MGSDLIRVTGMVSGMDTESMIQMYTSKANNNLQKAKNSKTLNTWTQDAWKSLNTKIYSFYSGTLANNRMSAAYKKVKTTTSNSALSVVSGSNAVQGVQTAKIKSTAKAGYMTGAEVETSDRSSLSATDSLASKLGIEEGSSFTIATKDGTEQKIQIGGTAADSSTKVVKNMNQLVSALESAGVNANFDTTNQRLFISAKETGVSKDFTLTGADSAGTAALEALGLGSEATKIPGSKAKLELNGAEFESDTNTFNINGNTYTINSMPSDADEEISITTATDYDGVYDVVKGMLKEYNELVNEMSKLYNADSAKGYDPLTDEQKEEMSEKEIEDWETKIKDSLLRGDSNLSGVMDALTSATMKAYDVDGKKMYLADFGITTQGYFEAEENERNALHIDGDPDDEVSAGKDDKLKAMIASDPEKVTSFFSKLSAELYDNVYKKMSGNSSMSSIYKVYNDKQLKQEATDWDTKISELEDKVTEIEDKWYSKFAAMETKLAKLQKNQTAVGGFFG